MKTLTLTLAAAALALGRHRVVANAQQLGAGHAQLQNATPIVSRWHAAGSAGVAAPASYGRADPTAVAGAGPASKRLSVTIDRMRGRLYAARCWLVHRGDPILRPAGE